MGADIGVAVGDGAAAQRCGERQAGSQGDLRHGAENAERRELRADEPEGECQKQDNTPCGAPGALRCAA